MRRIGVAGLVFWLAAGAAQAGAQAVVGKYARPAPLAQYLTPCNAEIALARSGAPAAISDHATILVLGRHGYETAVRGTNGWVCVVERGWVAPFDLAAFWNPKIRGADCLNPPAARWVVPVYTLRSRLAMAGDSIAKMIQETAKAIRAKPLPALEPGAMGYMMGKGSYLTDQGDHNGPHLMYWVGTNNESLWGAMLSNSPVIAVNQWFTTKTREASRFPPMTIFAVPVTRWSDGTPAK